jgi:hypothetical protein
MQPISIETFTQKNIDLTVQENSDVSNINYGVLKLKASNNLPTHTKQHLILSIDRSGSMDTVIQNVKHCLKNIVHYLIEISEDSQELYSIQIDYVLTIILFDHQIKYLCKQQNISDLIADEQQSQDKLLKKISRIQVRGMTNIENVFNAVNQTYMEDYTNIHIFMTDGEPTKGMCSKEELQSLLLQDQNQKIQHNFLGFGIDHNATMLNYFTNNTTKASYYFIDNIENAGMIYGEILDKVTFKNITNIKILSNSPHIMLFDVKTTKWMTEISGLDMGNEDVYIYHFKILDGYAQHENVFAVHYVTQSSNTNVLYHTIQPVTNPENTKYVDILTNRIENIKLMSNYQKQMYPQIETHSQTPVNTPTTYTNDSSITLKDKINSHFTALKEIDVELPSNKQIIQQLTDDLYIHIKLYNNLQGYMYCLARYNAQIYQQSYNITKIDSSLFSNDYVHVPFHRGAINSNNNINTRLDFTQPLVTPPRFNITMNDIVSEPQSPSEIGPDLLDNYTMSQDPFSVYATPHRNYTMRCVSNGTNRNVENPLSPNQNTFNSVVGND